ncbi:MAG TPA: LTA synthase family protein [Nocardioides sp.]
MVRGETDDAGARSCPWWRRRRVLRVPPSRWPARRALSAFLGAVGLFVIAVVVAFAVNLAVLRAQPEGPGQDWVGRLLGETGVLGADVLVVWVLLLFVWAVVGRWWWTVGLVLALVPVVVVAATEKLRQRNEPLYPSDLDFLSEPGFLLSMISPGTIVLVLLAVVLIVAAVGGGGELLTGRWRRRRARGRELAAVVAARVVVLMVTGVLVVQMGRFNESDNRWRDLYEARGAQWRPWSQAENYLWNSFVGGFLYNMPTDAMARPDGYSDEAMDELVARYSDLADEINVERHGSLADTNVVVVLSESFSDPTALEGLTLAEDPIPFTRELMAGTRSGSMIATGIGGGTANAEFEVLTGQSIGLMRPQMVVPYQMLVPNFASYPSLVGALGAEGHRAVAVHPFRSGMYKRQEVYDTFGFDTFVDEEALQFDDRTGANPYVDDASAFDEVLAQIEDSDAPLVTNLVTMQNHSPYGAKYDDPIGVELDPDLGVNDSLGRSIGDYARGLRHSDDALRDFIGALEESDEDTVVLFYGDHLPALYGETLRGINGDLAMHETPFFAWSNRGDNVPRSTGPVSSAFLLPYVFEAADAPVPPYLALLQAFRDEVGSVFQGRIVTPRGDVVGTDELSTRQARLLHDLRLVQYDATVGSRHATDALWPGSTGERD